MTTEEKRVKLCIMCDKADWAFCDEKCPLYNTDDCRFEDYCDEEIDRVFEKVFGASTEDKPINPEVGMDYRKAWQDAARLNDRLQFENRQLKETIVAMCKSFYELKGGEG